MSPLCRILLAVCRPTQWLTTQGGKPKGWDQGKRAVEERVSLSCRSNMWRLLVVSLGCMQMTGCQFACHVHAQHSCTRKRNGCARQGKFTLRCTSLLLKGVAQGQLPGNMLNKTLVRFLSGDYFSPHAGNNGGQHRDACFLAQCPK